MARPKEFDPDQAVEAAMELFWAQGYATTTPADLVDHLGIGRGSLYNAFGSKAELYQRALDRYRAATTALLRGALEGEGTPMQRIRQTVRAIVGASSSAGDRRGCMVTNAAIETAPHDPATAAVVAVVLEAQVDAFRDVIAAGQAAGEIDGRRDAGELARFLVTFLNGTRVLQRGSADPATLGTLADVAVDALLPH